METGMPWRRRERGSFARELIVGVALVVVVAAACFGLAVVAFKLGSPVVGRVLAMLPISIPGVLNLWLVWRPGDQHEAATSYRVSAATRGLAMVIPCAVFAVDPHAMPVGWLIGIFLGGNILSFVAFWLVDLVTRRRREDPR